MKQKIKLLRDKISENINHLSKYDKAIFKMLEDLNIMVKYDIKYDLMLKWWEKKENQINKINEVLKRK